MNLNEALEMMASSKKASFKIDVVYGGRFISRECTDLGSCFETVRELVGLENYTYPFDVGSEEFKNARVEPYLNRGCIPPEFLHIARLYSPHGIAKAPNETIIVSFNNSKHGRFGFEVHIFCTRDSGGYYPL